MQGFQSGLCGGGKRPASRQRLEAFWECQNRKVAERQNEPRRKKPMISVVPRWAPMRRGSRPERRDGLARNEQSAARPNELGLFDFGPIEPIGSISCCLSPGGHNRT